jgi:hypothetical protein
MSDAPFSARRKGGYVVPSSYHPSHLHFARLAASNSGGPCALDDARTPRLAGLRQRRQHSLKVTGNEVWSQQIILATVGVQYLPLLYPLSADLAHSSWLVVQNNNETEPMFLSFSSRWECFCSWPRGSRRRTAP